MSRATPSLKDDVGTPKPVPDRPEPPAAAEAVWTRLEQRGAVAQQAVVDAGEAVRAAMAVYPERARACLARARSLQPAVDV